MSRRRAVDHNPTPRGDVATGSVAGQLVAVLMLLFGIFLEGRVVNLSEAVAILTPVIQLGAAYFATRAKISVMAISGAVAVIIAAALAYFSGGQVDAVILMGAVSAIVSWGIGYILPNR